VLTAAADHIDTTTSHLTVIVLGTHRSLGVYGTALSTSALTTLRSRN